jgi:acyl dehydratase
MAGEPRYFDDVDFGDEIQMVERPITTKQVVNFVEAWLREPKNRFTDPESARKENLPEPIVPGALTMALLGRLLAEWAPNATVHKVDVVFRGNIYHNQPYKWAGIIVEKDERDGQNIVECDLYVENDKQERPVTGKATLSLPSRG